VEDEFAGRVALVTGAAGQGIGQAVARRLAAGAATVVVTDRHPERTRKVTAAIAADHPATRVVGKALDVRDRAATARVIAEVTGDVGPVTILVNNVAANTMGGIFDCDPATWDDVLAVNLTAPWNLARLTMPAMRDAGGGVIVNIGSYAADVGGEGLETPYAVSKGGLNTLTRALAHEGGPHGIRCVCVSMGIVRGTKFVDAHPELLDLPSARSPLGLVPDARAIAETVTFLASDRAHYITGEIVNVAAGAYMRT
jgi:3-oxoacyl-[acyl-carrier protein] reductase